MDRSRLGRGLAIPAVAALAVAVVSPAFSAAPVTKAKVKKIAKKQIKKLVPGMIDAATLDQGAIPAVTASITDPNKTVFTKGPFTISLDCSDDAGDVGLELLARTTEANSVVTDGDSFIGGDLDPADGDQLFSNETGNAPGGDAVSNFLWETNVILQSPSGTNVYAQFDAITNYKGSHCYVDGFFLDLAG
jgi:hypothetical protein